MLLTSSWLADLLIVLITISFLTYKYYTRNFYVFTKRGVKHIKPTPFLGNFASVLFFKEHTGEWLMKLHREFDDVPYFGVFIFDVPYLVIKSPEIIKNIMMKDFNHFMDRTSAVSNYDEIQKNAMFFQKGEEWKATRSKLTSVFTSGRLKAMFPILTKNGVKLTEYIKATPGPIELEDMSARYVADNIGRIFFGMDIHGLEDAGSEFVDILIKGQRSSLKVALTSLCYQFQHQFVNTLRLKFGDSRMVDFSVQAIKHAFEAREQSSVRVNDLVDIIRDLQQNEEFSNYWDFKGMKVLAQPFQFFIAGHATTTGALTHALYHLAMNSDIQDNLRSVIQDMTEEYGGITYEALTDKKYSYIDRVLNGK
ncbi:unnamed protein product [Acanthoscelides obtectus]|uniref:Cytochrome P450 n=1 Tax=Acanthoscelides obtectus TaxID=200917 RepID=A0A9P0L856_ACAOB|nr:unnamed protein product [Acanthoscelides obtectus]CAK1669551.1 Cytochrome P450 6j1 [Acanthoscelides obtectus]